MSDNKKSEKKGLKIRKFLGIIVLLLMGASTRAAESLQCSKPSGVRQDFCFAVRFNSCKKKETWESYEYLLKESRGYWPMRRIIVSLQEKKFLSPVGVFKIVLDEIKQADGSFLKTTIQSVGICDKFCEDLSHIPMRNLGFMSGAPDSNTGSTDVSSCYSYILKITEAIPDSVKNVIR